MTTLAASSGIIIYENANKLVVCKKPAQWTSTFLFVTGILAIILLGNALLQLFVFENEYKLPKNVGLILFAVGMFIVIIFWRILLYRKKVNGIPVTDLEGICTFDFTNNNLLDGQQNILSPLSEVYLMRKMQLTSSSPELIVKWKSGSLTIVKGNPFSGGIAEIERILISKGIKKQ